MAGSFNRVILVGNLTRDPELRYISSGAAVVKFTLAVNEPRKDRSETTYVDIIAWDKLAEICNTYLKKGSSALVEGRLSIRSYTAKSGERRKATEIVASTMQMLDSAQRAAAASGSAASKGAESEGPEGDLDDLFDDDLPE